MTIVTLWAACFFALGNTVVVPNAQTTAAGNAPFAMPATPFRFQQTVGSSRSGTLLGGGGAAEGRMLPGS